MSHQYVFSMLHVSKTVAPQRKILKDISLSFFPGAKIGVLGLNGSGKSTVLKIMAGLDRDIEGEATPMPGIKIGYLAQEPELDPNHTVREAVEEGLGELLIAQKKLEEIYSAYADPDADFDELAAEQAKYEAILATNDANTEQQLDIAADALRLPPWDASWDAGWDAPQFGGSNGSDPTGPTPNPTGFSNQGVRGTASARL